MATYSCSIFFISTYMYFWTHIRTITLHYFSLQSSLLRTMHTHSLHKKKHTPHFAWFPGIGVLVQSHLGQKPRHGTHARLTRPSNSPSTYNSSFVSLVAVLDTSASHVCASSTRAILFLVKGDTIQPPPQCCVEAPVSCARMHVPARTSPC